MSDSTTKPRTPPPVAGEEPSLTRTIRSWLRSLGAGRNGDATLQDTLRDLLEQHEEAEHHINPEERMILTNLVKLGEMRVGDVMIPRADIIAVDVEASVDELVKTFKEGFHSRVPVYRDTLDNVLGMAHIKDLLAFWGGEGDFHVQTVMRDVLFVPPSMPVLDCLLRMRTRRIHMALVVDEYGGTDGIVTIEDLVEAIVGEIEDEHDEVEGPLFFELGDGELEADARTPVEDIESHFGNSFLPDDREEDVDTIGGVVAALAGRVPQRGEVIVHPGGVEFEVIEADARRIKRLRVRSTAAKGAAPEKRGETEST